MAMTFKTNLYPDASGTRELGSSTKTWKIRTDDLQLIKNVQPTLCIDHNGIELASTTTVSSKQNSSIYFRDKNEFLGGYIQTQLQTDRENKLQLYVRNSTTSGEEVNNNIVLGIKKDGSKTVSVGAPQAWRNAIGAVYTGGDTMTGALTLNTIIGTSANYGNTLPNSGVVGQIFFLKRSE